MKKREIKFVYDRVNEVIWDVRGSENLKNMSFDLFKLLDYMRKNEYFFDDAEVEIYYVEDCEKIDKLNRILEVIEEV